MNIFENISEKEYDYKRLHHDIYEIENGDEGDDNHEEKEQDEE